MDLTSLDIFRVVAREESITKAAQIVGRVQSNVTTRIQQLEEEIGASLFLREGKKMVLTPAGERLSHYADKLLSLHEEALQVVGTSAPVGELKLGSMEASAASRLPAPLAAFHQQWPEVDVVLTTGTTQALLTALADHKLDCALVAMTDDDVARLPASLQAAPMWSESLMLVLPKAHAVDEPVGLAAFAQGCTYRRAGEAWIRDVGLQPQINPVREVNSYHAIMASVAAGSCAAVMPKSVIDMYPRVRKQPMQTLGEMRTWLVWRAAFSTPSLTALHALLVKDVGG